MTAQRGGPAGSNGDLKTRGHHDDGHTELLDWPRRGTAMRVRSLEERIGLVARFSERVMPMFADGRLKPVVDRVVPMRQIETAHQAMQQNETFGKIVLAW